MVEPESGPSDEKRRPKAISSAIKKLQKKSALLLGRLAGPFGSAARWAIGKAGKRGTAFSNPPPDPRDSVMPVLAVPRSIRIWEKMRLPLFIGIVIAILVVVGVVTSNILTDRKVRRTIDEAQEAEALGLVEAFNEATSRLSELADENPGRCNAQTAFAWQVLAHEELFGAGKEDLAARVERSLSGCEQAPSAAAWAAHVAWLIEKGGSEDALLLCEAKAKEHPLEPRLAMACAWAKIELGSIDEALADLLKARERFPDYAPLLLLAGSTAYENDRWTEAIASARELSRQSPGHLYAGLLTIAMALPRWGGKPPSAKQVGAYVQDIGLLADAIEAGPPKYRSLGHFLKGRIELISGKPDEAVKILGEVTKGSKRPEHLAWNALALWRSKGAGAALELLEKRKEVQGPLVWHLRAELLLEHHRTDEAAGYLEKIKDNERLREVVAKTYWVAEVRGGRIFEAKKKMPERLGPNDLFVALELYEQLLERGDARGIDLLEERMRRGGLSECAEIIGAWHKSHARRALFKLGVYGKNERGVCAAALATMLLPGRVEPDVLKERAERAMGAAGENLWIRVHGAHAIWRADGLEAALKRLEEVLLLGPQAGPLRSLLAKVFISFGKPERALDILTQPQSDQELAWAIEAAREAKRKKRISELLKEAALRRDKGSKHPGLFCELLARDFRDKQYKQVAESGEDFYKNGGRWAARIARIAAWSYNYFGERDEAEALLDRAFRKVRRASGLGVSWDAKIAAIRLNLRRGGKFVFKARSNAEELHQRGVKDPWISYTFGFVNMNMGQKENAEKFYFEALAIDPAFKPAIKQLNEMNLLSQEHKRGIARVLGANWEK